MKACQVVKQGFPTAFSVIFIGFSFSVTTWHMVVLYNTYIIYTVSCVSLVVITENSRPRVVFFYSLLIVPYLLPLACVELKIVCTSI